MNEWMDDDDEEDPTKGAESKIELATCNFTLALHSACGRFEDHVYPTS
jgi:hypothetical protein